MLPTMPPLPENTSFKLDQDEFGQPRLRWNWLGLNRPWLKVVTAFCALAVVGEMISSLLVIILKWNAFGWTWLASWGCVCPVLCAMGLLPFAFAWGIIGIGRDASLILTEAWLLHDEGGFTDPGALARWDRWRLKQVRVEPRVDSKRDWGRGHQRLLLDDGGYHHVEIGQSLSDTDRQWLAGVIREWIVPPRLTQLSPENEGPHPPRQQAGNDLPG